MELPACWCCRMASRVPHACVPACLPTCWGAAWACQHASWLCLPAQRMHCASALCLPANLIALQCSSVVACQPGFLRFSSGNACRPECLDPQRASRRCCLPADLDALAYLYYLSTVVNSLRQYYSSIQGICILLVIVKEMRVLSMQKRLSIITTTLVQVGVGLGGRSVCRPACCAAHTSAVPASCSCVLMPSSQTAVLQVAGSCLAASTGVFAVWESFF